MINNQSSTSHDVIQQSIIPETNNTQPTLKSTSPNPERINGDDKDPDNMIERYKLGGRPALEEVCYLSIGPVIKSIFSIIESTCQTIWIKKHIGKKGLSAISLFTPYVSIIEAFGISGGLAGSNAISTSFATRKTEAEGGQIICDVLRANIFCGLIIMCALLPTAHVFADWMEVDDEVKKLGWNYILPYAISTLFIDFYLTLIGFVLGEGRTLLYAIITIVVSVADVAVFCPFWILGCESGMTGISLSIICTQGLCGLILLVLFFAGKFTMKPSLKQFFGPFSDASHTTYKASLSQGMANLFVSVPSILLRKLISTIIADKDVLNTNFAAFHVVDRWFLYTIMIIKGFAAGYFPSAGFSFGEKNFKRWLLLTLHVCWITCAWGLLLTIITMSIPSKVASIFSDDNDVIQVAGKMIKKSNICDFLCFVCYTVGDMNRSIARGIQGAAMGTLLFVVLMFCFGWIM